MSDEMWRETSGAGKGWKWTQGAGVHGEACLNADEWIREKLSVSPHFISFRPTYFLPRSSSSGYPIQSNPIQSNHSFAHFVQYRIHLQ
jgi:hypothetical protein